MSSSRHCGLEGPMLALHMQPERFESSSLLKDRVDQTRSFRCCTPSGCMFIDTPVTLLGTSCVRVSCSNTSCPFSGAMHRPCYERWEAGLVAHLRTVGACKTRGWTDKQRQQLLWTKKGMEMIQRVCTCMCRRGHLKRDVESGISQSDGKTFVGACSKLSAIEDEGGSGRRVRRKQHRVNMNTAVGRHGLPALSIQTVSGLRQRADSLGSAGSSPPSSGSEESPHSPAHLQHLSSIPSSALTVKKKSPCLKNEQLVLERLRHDSGNSLFGRRTDFSVFNVLPKHKINSYHIKMEDEGSQGNDDTRSFLLSSLATARMSHTFCVVCLSALRVYDRYPVIDGTFFLSPRQHSPMSLQVRYDGRVQFLSAVCMMCADSAERQRHHTSAAGGGVKLLCSGCQKPWNGSHLVLGTMYTYDVFAAAACCSKWLQCSVCERCVIASDQRLGYFSDYSNILSCPFCTAVDHHFVKPLSHYVHINNIANTGAFTATSTAAMCC